MFYKAKSRARASGRVVGDGRCWVCAVLRGAPRVCGWERAVRDGTAACGQRQGRGSCGHMMPAGRSVR